MSAFLAWLRHLPRSRPFLIDILLAAGSTVFLFLGVTPTGDALAYLLAALSGLPVVLRRKFPLTVMIVVGLAMGLYYALGYRAMLGQPGGLIALYTVVLSYPLGQALGIATASLTIYEIGVFLGKSPTILGDTLLGLLQTLATIVVARSAKLRSRRISEIAEHAQQLEHHAQLEAERAVVEERIRIARELHDVVSHHLSVIAVQANLASYVFDSAPETTRDALATITSTSTEALDELRRLLLVLRPPRKEPGDGVLRPQPGLADLPSLAARVREAGVPVRLRISGTPRTLPSGQQLCAYRVAQEALTNVIKHAGSAEAELTLAYQEDNLILRVTDTGAITVPARNPAGHGLIGMRERAGMYGGVLEIGTGSGRGFEIALTLPYPNTGRRPS